MEAERSSETLANFYQATRRHFPEGRILHWRWIWINLLKKMSGTDQLHWPEATLTSGRPPDQQIPIFTKEPESSLPCSQQLATGHYNEQI
jgi:hypothetical protein